VDKPSAEQVAWVFTQLIENGKAGGSFRRLIYDRLGFGPSDYQRLYEAGGMELSNILNAETKEEAGK